MPEIEKIALFDMDGTLCDYEKGLSERLEELRSPNEPVFLPPILDNAPEYIKTRADLIRASEEWWANLSKLKLGFDIWDLAEELSYRRMILTQGPKRNPASWSGKKRWIDKNLGQDTDVTITRDKGLVYGTILIDDFPKYVERWLTWRKNGVVIMPANLVNQNYRHPQVTRYDGTNLGEVKEKMIWAKNRIHNL